MKFKNKKKLLQKILLSHITISKEILKCSFIIICAKRYFFLSFFFPKRWGAEKKKISFLIFLPIFFPYAMDVRAESYRDGFALFHGFGLEFVQILQILGGGSYRKYVLIHGFCKLMTAPCMTPILKINEFTEFG